MAQTPTTIDGLPTLTIGPPGSTSLATASTIDPVNDYLSIYTNSVTSTQGINRNTLLGLSSAPMGLTDTQAASNKTFSITTLTAPVINGNITGTYTLGGTPTFPASVATLTGTQTLTNKTLTSPTINSPTITNATISADTISGYTTSTSGTIYGISITGGNTISSALSMGSTLTVAGLLTASNGFTLSSGTLTLPNASIQTAALLNGIIAARQGGTTGAASWASPGTSNTTTKTTNTFIQSGCVTSSNASATTVTFPIAFTQVPNVFCTVINSSGQWAQLNATPTVTTCAITAYSATSTLVATTVMWFAIGQ